VLFPSPNSFKIQCGDGPSALFPIFESVHSLSVNQQKPDFTRIKNPAVNQMIAAVRAKSNEIHAQAAFT
jgi:hypothetical protein